ncbi:radical SAM protein [Thermococcus sp. GR7]|uniref:radical SAM/SPASM domain-containing protein n=1 Tax=unclassified Thermococcus TaxID=2627626 RepID=UPI00142FF3F1|nr:MULTISPECIES: radical SAM protein [unclassified Thermococcus]NJE47488.1 radical SAM protein [Thermococcus sp. GR7]NJE78584.1 radical SAM protein [Thermococcus sp. GR4]NJF23538.1 radical SAM protein [Thermococcus sp. GR5]
MEAYLFPEIEITTACNLQCRHCRVPTTSPDFMSPTLFRRIIENLVKIDIPYLTLSGGEPLLHPDLFQFLDISFENDIEQVGIMTNATLLNDKMLNKLEKYKRYGEVCIGTSIDGFQEIHDWYRNKKGAFSKTLESVKKLVQRDFEVGINVTIHKKNFHTIHELLDFLSTLNITTIRIRPVLPAGKAENNKDILLNKDELVNVAHQLKLFIKQNKNKPAIRIVDPVLYTLVYLNGQEPPKNVLNGCTAGVFQVYIDVYGNIRPCPFLNRNVGNATIQNIEEIANTGIAKKRDQLVGKCGKCIYKYVCGGCRARALIYSGNILGGDPLCPLEI